MKDYLFSYTKKRQYFLVFWDALVLCLAVFGSYAIRVYINQKDPSFFAVLSKLNPWQIIVVLSNLFMLYFLDQYNLNRIASTIFSSVMVILSVWMAGLVISGIFFFFPKYIFGRQVLLIYLLVASTFMVLWRLLFLRWVLRDSGAKRLAVLGEGQIVSSFIEEMAGMPNSGFEVSSLCVVNRPATGTFLLPESLHNYRNVLDLLRSNGFDALAFDTTCGSFSDGEIRRILQLKYKNKIVYDLPTLFQNLTGKVPLSYIDGRWLLGSNNLQGELSVPYIKAKRTFDVVLASLLLIITLPVFVFVAVAIKIDSKGDVFFLQERLGIGRKNFKCYKFRTMFEGAENESGPIWSKVKDPRVTRVGRLFRKTHLDELPQFLNILKGEMSFVGPRPIRESFANKLAEKIPFYELRFNIKPGLSGWAQVNFDYAGSDQRQLEKFQYELFYIQNMSFFLDLLVVFKTVQKMFRGGGGT